MFYMWILEAWIQVLGSGRFSWLIPGGVGAWSWRNAKISKANQQKIFKKNPEEKDGKRWNKNNVLKIFKASQGPHSINPAYPIQSLLPSLPLEQVEHSELGTM